MSEPNIKLVAFCGSLRKGSFNRLALAAFIERLPAGVTLSTIEIGDWPLYDADVQAKGFPAGVQAAPMPIEPPVDVDRSGRIKVRDDFSLESHNEVFVVGDMASFVAGSSTLPGVAPAAMQGGRYVADMILRDLQGRPREPFSYRDKGQMATIGRSRAIASTGRMSFTGRMAWLIWLFVHVYYLVGFRNRALVLGQWAWNYLFSRRESRLIHQQDQLAPIAPGFARAFLATGEVRLAAGRFRVNRRTRRA